MLTKRLYGAGELARRAGVSARTLRYYDQKGLLPPTQRSRAGHRLYSDEDLVALEQILALKFLGFSLDEIAGYLGAGPDDLLTGLARQKALLAAPQNRIGTVIRAIETVESMSRSGQFRWEELAHIMAAMQMGEKEDMLDKYLTPEQARAMRDLSKASYSEEARRNLAERPTWTEEDQRRVDAEYAEIAEGQAPDGPVARELARRTIHLLQQLTQGDPEVEAGLNEWWQNCQALPDAERPPALPWGPAEGAFLAEAQAIYRQRQTSRA